VNVPILGTALGSWCGPVYVRVAITLVKVSLMVLVSPGRSSWKGDHGMTLRDRLRDRNTLMRVGFAALLLGNLVHWFLHPPAAFGQGLVDATFGLLIGISIGCLLASLRRTDR
jgi:hypothetical protein